MENKVSLKKTKKTPRIGIADLSLRRAGSLVWGCMYTELDKLLFRSWFCHLLATELSANYLVFWNISLICKT